MGKSETPSLEYFGPYEDIFRFQVFQIIAWGYEDALDRIRSADQAGQKEPAISGFIVSAIKDRKMLSERQGVLKWFSAECEAHVEAKRKSGGGRPRVDIIIEGSGFKYCPEYLFEAKRLRTPGYTVSKYTGSDGMGCYIEGHYGGRYDEAGMIGYVQSGTIIDWKKKIQKGIDRKKSELFLISPQENFRIHDSFPTTWISKHNRIRSKRPIQLIHILLDRCINESQTG